METPPVGGPNAGRSGRPLVHAVASPGVLVPRSELALSGGQAWSAWPVKGRARVCSRSAPESSSPCPGTAQEAFISRCRPPRWPSGSRAVLPPLSLQPGTHPPGDPEGPGAPRACGRCRQTALRGPQGRARVPPNSSYGSPSPTGAYVAAEGVTAPLSPWKLRLRAGAPCTLLRGSEASLPGSPRRPPASA